MGLKLTTERYPITVYRKDGTSNDGNPYSLYSTSVTSKIGENKTTAYVDLKFRKGVSVNNNAKIEIINAFPSASEYKGNKKISWVVMEFNVIEEGDAPADAGQVSNGFMDIPDDVSEDLPFA